MIKKFYSVLFFSILCIAASSVKAETRLLKQPSISESQIAFVFAGDIWIANRDGSQPRRLTSHPANESHPDFSPDGKYIAFTGNYDNNADVYVISVDGGQAKRLTYHSATDTVNGWSADGKRVVFASSRELLIGRSNQLFEISMEGGFPTKVMKAQVFEGQWSTNGKELAYRPYRMAYGGAAGWRMHRGGSSPPIWIMDVDNNQVEKIASDRTNNFNPMWVGDDVIFISDRDDVAANLYRYNRADKSVDKLTNEVTWDIASADNLGSFIVYEAGGRLKEINTANNTSRTLPIAINPDSSQIRPQWKNSARNIEKVVLSPTGKRALVSARGDIFTVPIKDGTTRNLSSTSGVRETEAIWSSNGESIAYLSDESMKPSLIISDQKGVDKTKYELADGGYFQLVTWSPDNKFIMMQDNSRHLLAFEISTGKTTKIDRSLSRQTYQVSFSPNSRYLAYTAIAENLFSQIKIYDFETKQSRLVTDRMSSASSPVFSKDGYLFFTASTNTGPRQVGLDMTSQERSVRSAIYLTVLTKDGTSPLLPELGDEELVEATEDNKDNDKESDENKKDFVIDFDGLLDRTVALPIAQRFYTSLAIADDGALFYLQRVQAGVSGEPPASDAPNAALYRFDFKEKKSEKVKDDVDGFSLSADGKKIVMRTGNQYRISDASQKLKAETISMSDVRSLIDPAQEWRQIYNDVWRMQKEFFYDDNLHGIDWDAMYEKYLPLLDHVVTREQLNDVLVMLIAELQVGHNNVGGGDIHRESSVAMGSLGADYLIENGRYKIERIYTGEQWNPFIQGPLSMPGLGISEGDYILAINGSELSSSDNLHQILSGKVGKQIELTFNDKPSLEGSSQVVVEPISNDRNLRLWHWIESNRKYVEKKTDGKVGYVYLPNTAGAGFQFFNRMFFAQIDKKALIIDERRNSGGQAANYITDVLSRQYLAGWKDRDSQVFDTPGGAIYGPKVMLIDQDAGSGGDFLPYSFKRMGLGKLIGKRTWGGLIGISTNPSLIDGGRLTVPYFRFFTPEGEWRVENEGVAPDIDVDLEPTMVNEGKDSQLDRAILEVMNDLQNYQPIRLDKAPSAPTELGK